MVPTVETKFWVSKRYKNENNLSFPSAKIYNCIYHTYINSPKRHTRDVYITHVIHEGHFITLS